MPPSPRRDTEAYASAESEQSVGHLRTANSSKGFHQASSLRLLDKAISYNAERVFLGRPWNFTTPPKRAQVLINELTGHHLSGLVARGGLINTYPGAEPGFGLPGLPGAEWYALTGRDSFLGALSGLLIVDAAALETLAESFRFVTGAVSLA
jgi:hypothetical protein